MGIFGGGSEDAILQSGLLKLALRLLADFGFEIRIGRGKESGVAGIDASFGAVKTHNQDLSKLFRNVPLFNSLEVSPFWILVFWVQ